MKEGQQPVEESALKSMSRRTLLRGASAATVVGMIGSRSQARTEQERQDNRSPPRQPGR